MFVVLAVVVIHAGCLWVVCLGTSHSYLNLFRLCSWLCFWPLHHVLDERKNVKVASVFILLIFMFSREKRLKWVCESFRGIHLSLFGMVNTGRKSSL